MPVGQVSDPHAGGIQEDGKPFAVAGKFRQDVMKYLQRPKNGLLFSFPDPIIP